MSDPRYRDDPANRDPVSQDRYRAARGSYGTWGIGALVVAIAIIAAIVYGYDGNRTNVANNNTPSTEMNAPAPAAPVKPTPAPATPVQRP